MLSLPVEKFIEMRVSSLIDIEIVLDGSGYAYRPAVDCLGMKGDLAGCMDSLIIEAEAQALDNIDPSDSPIC